MSPSRTVTVLAIAATAGDGDATGATGKASTLRSAVGVGSASGDGGRCATGQGKQHEGRRHQPLRQQTDAGP